MRSPSRSSTWSSSGYASSPSSSSPRASRAGSVDGADASSAAEVFKSIYNGRKSWKTLRGGEMVWPAELEAALIEGLELYQPDDSRETRLLGRFPMRNRFISEHIFRKTGKRRTAKQVGSRLQQLRETCTGDRLLNLLSPTRRQPLPNRSPVGSHSSLYDSGSSNGGGSAPITPTDDVAPYSFAAGSMSPPHTTYSVDILPQDGSQTPPLSGTRLSTAGSVRLFDYARRIHDIDPTLTFLSHQPISASCIFRVSSGNQFVFGEITALSVREMPPSVEGDANGRYLYSTPLVPGYWDAICNSPDPTQFIIYQEVTSNGDEQPNRLFTATYTFSYPCHPGMTTTPLDFSTYEDKNLHTDLQNFLGTETQDLNVVEHPQGYNTFDHPWLQAQTDKLLPHGGTLQTFGSDLSSAILPPMSAAFPSDLNDMSSYAPNFLNSM
ncbi:hypothetical protein CYLTODRAFT_422745 [Cylindrobasidium torrendii FP15055 ss-10]|uniref:TEA domain-containing protein n=1 Tax=Cylindrobasidium torrendii FP15055 ss-10 TaxID=1314674 RepID=A0A0D7BCD8_9AGAR|nr:hypothetical protein CYLTODRAFT_422745 [Cylindrobasidium torrendii FP15055 ss-10]